MATPSTGIGYAEAEALKRRKRILELRKKAEGKSVDESNEEPDSKSPSHELNEESQTDNDETPKKDENSLKNSILNEELDLSQLAPRKIDWDLKRGIERKLEILREATNNAIAELIQNDKVDDI